MVAEEGLDPAAEAEISPTTPSGEPSTLSHGRLAAANSNRDKPKASAAKMGWSRSLWTARQRKMSSSTWSRGTGKSISGPAERSTMVLILSHGQVGRQAPQGDGPTREETSYLSLTTERATSSAWLSSTTSTRMGSSSTTWLAATQNQSSANLRFKTKPPKPNTCHLKTDFQHLPTQPKFQTLPILDIYSTPVCKNIFNTWQQK